MRLVSRSRMMTNAISSAWYSGGTAIEPTTPLRGRRSTPNSDMRDRNAQCSAIRRPLSTQSSVNHWQSAHRLNYRDIGLANRRNPENQIAIPLGTIGRRIAEPGNPRIALCSGNLGPRTTPRPGRSATDRIASVPVQRNRTSQFRRRQGSAWLTQAAARRPQVWSEIEVVPGDRQLSVSRRRCIYQPEN